jgi:hypothetical protein
MHFRSWSIKWEKIPNFISGHRKSPRPSTNTTSMYETTYVNRTYPRTYRFIYIDSYTDILYYDTLVLMNCTSVYITYINGTHTHTRTLHFIYILMYRYTVLLYTSWQMDFNCAYTTVHCCTLLYNFTLPKHTLVVHTLCSDQLYCCTFIL